MSGIDFLNIQTDRLLPQRE